MLRVAFSNVILIAIMANGSLALGASPLAIQERREPKDYDTVKQFCGGHEDFL